MTDRVKLKRSTDVTKVSEYAPDVTFHAELKSEEGVDTGDLFISGYASTSDIDRVDDIVEPSAFKKTLKDFMKNPVLLLNHGMSAAGRIPVGKVVEADIRPKGLFVKALISKTEIALREKIKEGLYKAFSFGFKIMNSDVIKKTGKSLRKITDLELFEVSVVSIPANRRALFSVTKGFEFGSDLIYEDSFVEDLKENLEGTVGEISFIKNELKELKELKKWQEKKELFEEFPDMKISNFTEEDYCSKEIDEVKPAPEETENEIRIRRKDPTLFKQDSFRRITLRKDSPKVFAVIGKLIGQTSTEVQSYRFPKGDGWTISKAVAWVKANKVFEEMDFQEEDINEGIKEEANFQSPTDDSNINDILKSLEEEVEELKAGRVLSGSNRKTLSIALEAVESASVALKAVLDIQEADSSTLEKEESENSDGQLSDELIAKVAEAAINATHSILN